MTTFLECWTSVATSLFSQALAGEPVLAKTEEPSSSTGALAFAARLEGECSGLFSVAVDASVFEVPLLGEGVDQKAGWSELLREVAESAAGELLAKTGTKCHISEFGEVIDKNPIARAFQLRSPIGAWSIHVADATALTLSDPATKVCLEKPVPSDRAQATMSGRPGIDLLLDVELEVTLRFGCRELLLSEVLDLGPGDVVELDRQVSDPVDLIVGDKIVARGDVVLVDGNFGLRVIEVAEPLRRLESIRCLF
ncbi:MAG TPA: FliM/FliN family flagellar motor switch protein [Terracidiphilus sp.]|jgi:flagellar motor switch protein FliN|nr:FliM/FliN family flagellar motor switch protein [Terracidiphilus sp.]